MQSIINNTGQFCVFNEINLIQIIILIASHFKVGIQIFKVWMEPHIDKFLIYRLVKIFNLNEIILFKIKFGLYLEHRRICFLML